MKLFQRGIIIIIVSVIVVFELIMEGVIDVLEESCIILIIIQR